MKKPEDIFPTLNRDEQVNGVLVYILSQIELQKKNKPGKRKWKCKISQLSHSDEWTIDQVIVSLKSHGWLAKRKPKVTYVDGIFPVYGDDYLHIYW